MKRRSGRGFTLVLVLMLGAVLLIMGTTVFVLATGRTTSITGERGRVEAALTADSALAFLRNVFGPRLLALDDGGGRLGGDAGPFGLYRQGDRYYLGYPRLDPEGRVLGLHDLAAPANVTLPTSFEQTGLRAGGDASRWWVHRLGTVRWIPLDIPTVTASSGRLAVAVRQAEVVGEAGGSRAAIAQTLRLSVDLTAQSTTRRPQVALAAIPVARVAAPRGPLLTIRGAPDQAARLRIEGPLLVEGPPEQEPWLQLAGKAQMSVTAGRDPRSGRAYGELDEDGRPTPAVNPDLFNSATDRSTSILLQGGERRLSKPPEFDLEARLSDYGEGEGPGVLQLTTAYARFIGRAGTIVRKDFNPRNNLLNPLGEKLYDARTASFDFTRARRGILFLDERRLTLKGEPYRVFTYRGQGTLVIVTQGTCLTLENASLIPATDTDSLTVLCASRPLPPDALNAAGNPSVPDPRSAVSTPTAATNTTVSTTTDTTTNAQPPAPPPGVRFAHSAAIPMTILADARGIPFRVRLEDTEIEPGQPPGQPTTLRRLISSISIGDISLPSGSRVVTLDRRNYLLARLSERDEAQALVSIGVASNQQQGSLQLETVRKATVVPLVRFQGYLYSNAPLQTEGSVRVVGSLTAPAITIGPPRYAPTTQNLLYGDPRFGLRYLFDAIYRRLPEGPGTWLITFRPRRAGQPAVPVTHIDALLWQRLDFERWNTPPDDRKSPP